MANPARELHTQQTHYLRKRVNYNDTNISGGVYLGTLPAGAMIVNIAVRVATAFNAGTTNALNIGTSAGGTQIATDAATAGTRQPSLPNVSFASDQDIYVAYAQTGTAASAGLADIVIQFAPNNDL